MALIVLDASVVVAFFKRSDRHHARAVEALERCRDEDLRVPASAYAETLVHHHRVSPARVAEYEQAFDETGLRVEVLTRAIARRAARLRARHAGIRLPDALVLATGQELGATTIFTADASWKSLAPNVEVV